MEAATSQSESAARPEHTVANRAWQLSRLGAAPPDAGNSGSAALSEASAGGARPA